LLRFLAQRGVLRRFASPRFQTISLPACHFSLTETGRHHVHLDRISLALDRIGRSLAALCCAVMFLLVIGDILLRNVGVTFPWSIEYSGFLMAFIVFLPLAGVTRRREHMAADFFLNSIGGRVESSSRRALIPLANLIFAGVLLYLGWAMMLTSYADGVNSMGPLRTPIWIPQVVMVIGLAALTFSAAVDLLRWSNERAPSELDQITPITNVEITNRNGT